MLALRNRVVALVLLALGAWSGEAAAVFCPIQPFHVTFWVGDKASHAMCAFDTIQDAVNAVQCPNTEIVLTHEHTYTAQHITINSKPSMTLVGVDVPVACGAEPAAGSTFQRPITGNGNGGHSVFSITNSDVTFQNLDISGGHTTINARGGGISAAGTSHITLQQTTVEDNSADFGGGVAIIDTGTLTMGDHTGIIANTARANGGGVFLAGSAHMDMRGDKSTIASNQATGHDGDFGYGGGVFVSDSAIADISGTIGFNSARAGGGVAAFGANEDHATIRLFSVDPARPVLVLANQASVHGGGLYAKASATVNGAYSIGDICAQDFRIVDNRAPDGAAIYGADDTGGGGAEFDAAFYLNRRDSTSTTLCSAGALAGAGIGAPSCVAGAAFPCNEISGNEALDASGAPSGGAIVKGSSLELDRMNMHDNDGGEMIYGYDRSHLVLTNSLVADNHAQHEIVHLDQGIEDGTSSDTGVRNVTIINNTIDNGSVIFVKHGFSFENNLIWQPGRSTIDYQTAGCDACFHAKNALVSEAASFPAGLAILAESSLDAFGFIDPSNADVDKRDYHLGAWLVNRVQVFAPAVDFAASVSGDDRDLDNLPRDQDISGIDNGAGPRDLGCFELQRNQFISDRIFADGYGDPIQLLL